MAKETLLEKTKLTSVIFLNTVEPLIAPLLPPRSGGRNWEVAAIQRFTTNMGKRLGLKVSGRYREVAAIRRWPHLEVRL